jgi:hypothetical protein
MVPGLDIGPVSTGAMIASMTQTLTPPPIVFAPAAPPLAGREGPSASGLEVAALIQQVTRVLGMRDLDALDAGREVVVRLDEFILPQTVLKFRPVAAELSNPRDAGGAQILVSVQTDSDEVRAFLDAHSKALIDAMAIEAPGLRWQPGAVNTPEPIWAQGQPDDSDLGESEPRDRGASSDSGRGQRDRRSPDTFADLLGHDV